MAEDAAPFSDRELAAARVLFPGDDVQLHDGTLVIARPPDAAARFATAAIARSLQAHRLRSPSFEVQEQAEVRFDACNIRRYAIAVWDGASSVPMFVVVVLRGGDHLRWGRGKVNRALEFGVRRGLLVDPNQRDITLFEGIERSAVGTSIECDLIPGWSLAKAAIFANVDSV